MPTPDRATSKRRLAALLLAAACGGLLLAAPQPAAAAEWVFYRSYFTHAVPPEIEPYFPRPRSRSAYRPAIAGGTPGLSIRGGYRYNRIFLGAGGSSPDLTILRENWYELEH
ncbi:MAG: hypothetical protein KY476_17810 [Planctomycetes bacterium]|nr:hypothetical protein [Planctomycetota bacterium]